MKTCEFEHVSRKSCDPYTLAEQATAIYYDPETRLMVMEVGKELYFADDKKMPIATIRKRFASKIVITDDIYFPSVE